MADPKELFSTLKATSGGAGVPLDQGVDNTTAAAALNGAVAFAFKNSAGNVILPQLTATGAVPVTATAGVAKSAPYLFGACACLSSQKKAVSDENNSYFRFGCHLVRRWRVLGPTSWSTTGLYWPSAGCLCLFRANQSGL